MKTSIGVARAVRRSATSRRPVFHVVMSVKTQRRDHQRQPAALRNLDQVGAEERDIHDEEDGGHGQRDPAAATPSARSRRRAAASP